MCVESWGKVITERLHILEEWALNQGLELAAECHLAKINQCADFLQVFYIVILNSLYVFYRTLLLFFFIVVYCAGS